MTIQRAKKGFETRRAFECGARRHIGFELEFCACGTGLAVPGVVSRATPHHGVVALSFKASVVRTRRRLWVSGKKLGVWTMN